MNAEIASAIKLLEERGYTVVSPNGQMRDITITNVQVIDPQLEWDEIDLDGKAWHCTQNGAVVVRDQIPHFTMTIK